MVIITFLWIILGEKVIPVLKTTWKELPKNGFWSIWDELGNGYNNKVLHHPSVNNLLL